MIKEIITEIIDNLKSEIEEFIEIKYIDYIDIFPKSELERKELDSEMLTMAKLFNSNNKGNFYLLNNPFKTIYGNITIVKIRIFDDSKLKWRGHPDFKLENYSAFKKKYIKHSNFKLIKGSNYEMLEYINKDKLIYFPNILLSEDEDIIKKINLCK